MQTTTETIDMVVDSDEEIDILRVSFTLLLN